MFTFLVCWFFGLWNNTIFLTLHFVETYNTDASKISVNVLIIDSLNLLSY